MAAEEEEEEEGFKLRRKAVEDALRDPLEGNMRDRCARELWHQRLQCDSHPYIPFEADVEEGVSSRKREYELKTSVLPLHITLFQPREGGRKGKLGHHPRTRRCPRSCPPEGPRRKRER